MKFQLFAIGLSTGLLCARSALGFQTQLAYSVASLSKPLIAKHVWSATSASCFRPKNGYSKSSFVMSSDAAVSADADPVADPLFEPIGKGIVRDFKARLPYTVSDIKDGLNIQVCKTEMPAMIVSISPQFLLTRIATHN